MAAAVVLAQLDPLGVDQDHADLVRRGPHQRIDVSSELMHDDFSRRRWRRR